MASVARLSRTPHAFQANANGVASLRPTVSRPAWRRARWQRPCGIVCHAGWAGGGSGASEGGEDGEEGAGDEGAAAGGTYVEDAWKLQMQRRTLEDSWIKARRKSRPRYLPFVEARKWAIAMNMDSREEWEDWLLDGKRTPYIPSDPEQAYAGAGWVSWDDWLGIEGEGEE